MLPDKGTCPVPPEVLIERAEEALNRRYAQLEAERQIASRERIEQIDAEQDGIQERLAEIVVFLANDLQTVDLRRLGEPIQAATIRKRVTTPDGFWIETVDTGKRVVCRCGRAGHDEEDVETEYRAGPYSPYVVVPIEQLEHCAYAIASYKPPRRRRPR
jgi:hypothetical protein